MEELQKHINIVKEDIQKRFPGGHYTVAIILWDDNTSSVECKHGTSEKIHISKFYDGKLTYEEFDVKFPKGMMVDKDGTEYFPKRPILSTEELKEMALEMIFQITGNEIKPDHQCEIQGDADYQIAMTYLRKVNER